MFPVSLFHGLAPVAKCPGPSGTKNHTVVRDAPYGVRSVIDGASGTHPTGLRFILADNVNVFGVGWP